MHEPYRALAEVPEGLEHPFNPERREPFSLCPLDPGSLALLADLYDQLLPCFASRELNVGLDETFDLVRGRSAEACAERGKVRVYLDFLRAVKSGQITLSGSPRCRRALAHWLGVTRFAAMAHS